MTDIPSTLQLPKTLLLDHVTAADLTQLSSALETSQHVVTLSLAFDEVVVESTSERKKGSRVKTQTRRAMTRWSPSTPTDLSATCI